VRRLLALAAIGSSLLGAAGAASASASASASGQRFFLSPTRNISCELDVHSGGTHAFCETLQPGRSVTMAADGSLKVCDGTGCLGNPPDNATVLAYGHQSRLGPFTCTSRPTGVRCTVAGSGRGFVISRSGIARV
jgi:hypothetical protein